MEDQGSLEARVKALEGMLERAEMEGAEYVGRLEKLRKTVMRIRLWLVILWVVWLVGMIFSMLWNAGNSLLAIGQ